MVFLYNRIPIFHKKTETSAESVAEEAEQKSTKKAPQVKAKKEYTGPFVEGEDF